MGGSRVVRQPPSRANNVASATMRVDRVALIETSRV
jgi:hypothetical protein